MKTLRIARLHAFASRRIIGIQLAGTRPWQIDYMLGPWRPFSYRRGIRKPGRHYLDLGRLGVLRWGRLGTATVTITPDFTAFNAAMERTAEHMRTAGQAWVDGLAKLKEDQ